MKPIGLVAHQPTVPSGVIGETLRADGVEHRIVRAWDPGEPWPRPQELSALIVLGGEMNVDDVEHHPFLLDSRRLTGAAIEAGVPVLGVCLGGQMIARHLGAEVVPGTARQVGFFPLETTEEGASDEVMAPIQRLEAVFQWHEDRLGLPGGVTVLHRDPIALQSFRHGEHAYAVQFHFEMTEDIVRSWCDETPDLEGTWGITRQALLEQAAAMLPPQQEAAAEVTRRFISIAARAA